MRSAGTEGVVLVVGSGSRLYREYLLESASFGHPLWLFDPAEPDWQCPYIQGSTVVDVLDRAALLAAARELTRSRGIPVRGVLSWDEALIVEAAHLAHALDLPGPGPAAIEGCRDKPHSRALLTEAGLRQPGFEFVEDEAAAVKAAERLGLPVVVKPRAGGASIGVMIAETAAAVREAYHLADDVSQNGTAAYIGGALVESYLAGPEISVDGAVVAGRYTPLFLARKTVGMRPYFEELGHLVDAADPLLADADLLATLQAAHTAIGFGYGVTHTELKLTADGPVIVEINGRLGGDLIPLLGKLATGIEPGAVAVRVALGREPEVERSGEAKCVGIRFGYPRQDCVVQTVTVPEPGAGLVRAAALVDTGTRLELPPSGFISRHAYVICEAGDPAGCSARLYQALSEVRLIARPLTAAEVRSAASPSSRPTEGEPTP